MHIDADKLRQAIEDVETVDSELVNFYRTAEHFGFDPEELGTVSLDRALKVYGTVVSKDKDSIVAKLESTGSCEIEVPEEDENILHGIRMAWIDGALAIKKLMQNDRPEF